jgi:hypothetical protein
MRAPPFSSRRGPSSLILPDRPDVAFGLVGWWTFEGGSMANQTGWVPNAKPTMPAGATFVASPYGTALNLPLGANPQVPVASGATPLTNTPSQSLACWVNLLALTGNSAIFGVFNTGIALQANTGPLWVGTFPSSGQILTGGAPRVGVWTHLALTYENATGVWSLYVNGVRVSSAVSAKTLAPALIQFGASTVTTVQLADCRLYNRAISAAEVLTLYAGSIIAAPFEPPALTASVGPPPVSLPIYDTIDEQTLTAIVNKIITDAGLSVPISRTLDWQHRTAVLNAVSVAVASTYSKSLPTYDTVDDQTVTAIINAISKALAS